MDETSTSTAAPVTEPGPAPVAPEGGLKKRILVVDDERDILESIQVALERAGYDVLIARDGNQGLAQVERGNPDLVILDIMMPRRGGLLVLERLRVTQRVPVRVIMNTANEGQRHRAYAESLGVDGYLHKGKYTMEELLDLVARLLK